MEYSTPVYDITHARRTHTRGTFQLCEQNAQRAEVIAQ